jgi:hypothetical protein
MGLVGEAHGTEDDTGLKHDIAGLEELIVAVGRHTAGSLELTVQIVHYLNPIASAIAPASPCRGLGIDLVGKDWTDRASGRRRNVRRVVQRACRVVEDRSAAGRSWSMSQPEARSSVTSAPPKYRTMGAMQRAYGRYYRRKTGRPRERNNNEK